MFSTNYYNEARSKLWPLTSCSPTFPSPNRCALFPPPSQVNSRPARQPSHLPSAYEYSIRGRRVVPSTLLVVDQQDFSFIASERERERESGCAARFYARSVFVCERERAPRIMEEGRREERSLIRVSPNFLNNEQECDADGGASFPWPIVQVSTSKRRRPISCLASLSSSPRASPDPTLLLLSPASS